VGIAVAVFLAILLVTWLLLPLWVLFIQWNTGKIRDELRNLVDLIEKKGWDEEKKIVSGPRIEGIFLILFLCWATLVHSQGLLRIPLYVKDKEIRVEVANTPEDRAGG